MPATDKPIIRRLGLFAVTLLGILVAAGGLWLLRFQDRQAIAYNEGVALYKTGQFEPAIAAFDKSLSLYERAGRRKWHERFLFPPASRELAALAAFHRGNALITSKNFERAVDSYKESLKLNPGNDYANLAGFQTLGKEDSARLIHQALLAKHNLELLLKSEALELSEQDGKGDKKKNEEEDDKEQVPMQAPGAQPGKGGNEDI
jgi:tetratricopeptide (TPR) repeat protein